MKETRRKENNKQKNRKGERTPTTIERIGFACRIKSTIFVLFIFIHTLKRVSNFLLCSLCSGSGQHAIKTNAKINNMNIVNAFPLAAFREAARENRKKI